MDLSKKKLASYDQNQRHYIQNIFDEFQECGPHYMSFTTTQDQNFFFFSNSSEWERVFKEENLLEKDMFNYIEDISVPRKWVCWDNLPLECDPYNLTQRRIDICQTVKSASFIVPVNESLHTFNFAFDRDLDIEAFIWENNLLIESYAFGMAKMLGQSGSQSTTRP